MSHLKSNWQTVVIPAAGGRLVGPNLKRKGLIISCISNASMWINADHQPAAVGDGLLCPAAGAMVKLGGELCACWVTGDVFAITNLGANATVTYVEIF